MTERGCEAHLYKPRGESVCQKKGGQNFKANAPGKEIFEVGREGKKENL